MAAPPDPVTGWAQYGLAGLLIFAGLGLLNKLINWVLEHFKQAGQDSTAAMKSVADALGTLRGAVADSTTSRQLQMEAVERRLEGLERKLEQVERLLQERQRR